MKLLILLLITVICSCSESQVSLPSRADCIVRVDFVKAEMEGLYPTISKAIRSSEENGFKAVSPSLAIPHEKRYSMYLQYENMCSERFDLTKILFSEFVEPSIPKLPKYKISKDPIHPSPSTIDIKGVYWVD